MAEIPELPLTLIPSPTSVDLTDEENLYPLLDAIQGPPAADSVGPEAANQQPRALDLRTETLRELLNQIVNVANSLNENLLHRDGADAEVDGNPSPSFMRGDLDMGDDPTAPVPHKVINMAAGTSDGDGVNKAQLDAVQAYLNGLTVSLGGALRIDGTNAMTDPLNLGGNVIEFVGTPINVADAVTKAYADSAILVTQQSYLPRDGTLPMTGNLNMGGNKVVNMDLSAPTADGDGISRAYLLQVLSAIAATPPGTIAPFAGDEVSLPAGWLICDGSEVSRLTYANLFDAIGIAHGAGNGTTTFNLPDMRGRVAVGMDSMGSQGSANRVTNAQADIVGGTFGSETHQLIVAELPPHTHPYNDKYVGADTGGADVGPANTNSTSQFTDQTGRVTGSTGSGTPHANIQPSIALLMIVKF